MKKVNAISALCRNAYELDLVQGRRAIMTHVPRKPTYPGQLVMGKKARALLDHLKARGIEYALEFPMGETRGRCTLVLKG